MRSRKFSYLLAIAFLSLLLSVVMTAQVKTETSTNQGQPTVETTVERGEVVYVSGNDLVVKMEDGEIRNFPNVPETARVTVDGKQLSVHDLKPGMKLERTITTTSTPETIVTIQTVTGTVWQVNPPNSLILTLEDGSNQQFKIPAGQKFNVEGTETDAFGLRKGMKVSATKIVAKPVDVTTQERKVTGQMPPPSTEAIQGPLLIQAETTKPAEVAQAKPAEAQPVPKKLPQTASELPLIGLIGVLALFSSVAVFTFCSRNG